MLERLGSLRLRCCWVATIAVLFCLGARPVAAQDNTGSGGTVDFAGLGFGVGVSLSWDTGGDKDRVKVARVVNGIVRVEVEENTEARIMLESHYFFQTRTRFLWAVDKANWGHGPFIALQPGTDEIIETIGLGWMVGFRKPDDNGQASSASWNFGMGIVVDPNANVLGDGIEANQPLPAGETEIRYKQETEAGVLFISSFRF